jgi:hypothetical protein
MTFTTIGSDSLLDALLPEFDATRIEHRVIDAPPGAVYSAAIGADLVDAMRRSTVVRGLFALRAAGERAVATVRRTPVVSPPELPTMRLGELTGHGDWVRLAANPPHEFAFGAIGRFWGGETTWTQIDSSAFASFDEAGYAKIVASLSLRSYGDRRTLLTYEARTQATDDVARQSFMRYWRFVSPGVGIVMRSALSLIADEAIES